MVQVKSGKWVISGYTFLGSVSLSFGGRNCLVITIYPSYGRFLPNVQAILLILIDIDFDDGL